MRERTAAVRAGARRLRWESLARAAVGPMALAGFFLPWAHGPGPLAATEFTGFTLVGYAGRLRALDLPFEYVGALWAARLLILGVAVAGAWQTILAPVGRWHPAYGGSGWYLAGAAVLAGLAGLWAKGLTLPPPGLALLLGAGALFAVLEMGRTHHMFGGRVPPATSSSWPVTNEASGEMR